jgi:hypothetical protein
MEVELHSLITSAVVVKWSISCPSHLTPEKEPSYSLNRSKSGYTGREKSLIPAES